jgi:hypothetical protein
MNELDDHHIFEATSLSTLDFANWYRYIEKHNLYSYEKGLDYAIADVQFEVPISEIHEFTGRKKTTGSEDSFIYVYTGASKKVFALPKFTYKEVFDIISNPGYSANSWNGKLDIFAEVVDGKLFFGYYVRDTQFPNEYLEYMQSVIEN